MRLESSAGAGQLFPVTPAPQQSISSAMSSFFRGRDVGDVSTERRSLNPQSRLGAAAASVEAVSSRKVCGSSEGACASTPGSSRGLTGSSDIHEKIVDILCDLKAQVAGVYYKGDVSGVISIVSFFNSFSSYITGNTVFDNEPDSKQIVLRFNNDKSLDVKIKINNYLDATNVVSTIITGCDKTRDQLVDTLQKNRMNLIDLVGEIDENDIFSV